jgi:hypothetical protein
VGIQQKRYVFVATLGFPADLLHGVRVHAASGLDNGHGGGPSVISRACPWGFSFSLAALRAAGG